MSKKKDEIKIKKAPCCEGCAIWETHRDKCFYFWEEKKNCTQHSGKGNTDQDFSKIIK